MRELDPISLTEPGVVKRIRGVSYTMRVSPLVGVWRRDDA